LSIIDKQKNTISIIIVNYKSWGHVENCLRSIDQFNDDSFLIEVIVVDNNSCEGKLGVFSKKFPQYQFIPNTANKGFSNANNLGTQYAKGAYFLFLNPDTLINSEALKTMLSLSLKHGHYGIISCTKLNNKGKAEKEIRFFPKLYNLFGFSRSLIKLINKRKIKEKFNKHKSIIYPDWVSGSVMFMSKKWFNSVGKWNEDFWLYLEDVDLCKRVNNAGGLVVLTREVAVVHNHGGASRINLKTTALTKSEVLISKHVYINNHFDRFKNILAQIILVVFVVLTQFFCAIFGLIFFFVPKLYLHFLIFLNMISYYKNALIHQTWLSKRAPNFIK